MKIKNINIFDVFYKLNKIYILLPIINEPLHENDIIFKVNNKELILQKKLERNEKESILIFIYTFVNENNELLQGTLTYNEDTINFPIKNIETTERYEVTLTTLLKDDYKLFTPFHYYYTYQGVEHFYIYYNGAITKEISEYFQDFNNVTLIEWNFKYNVKTRPRCGFPKCRLSAQLGQMHHALYKYGKDYSNYMIFCDLDEYLHINNETTLYDYIKDNQNKSFINFCNMWARTENIPVKLKQQ